MSDSSAADLRAADALQREVAVLLKLVYRATNQHRRTKYFQELHKASRIYSNRLRSPALPQLLEDSAGVLTRRPGLERKSLRLQQAWCTEVLAAAGRVRTALQVCVDAMVAGMQASKLLAHQISQTFFVTTSVLSLAALARLHACALHLAARLCDVHAALAAAAAAVPTALGGPSAAALSVAALPQGTALLVAKLRNTATKALQKSNAAVTPGSSTSPAEPQAGDGDSEQHGHDVGEFVGRAAATPAASVAADAAPPAAAAAAAAAASVQVAAGRRALLAVQYSSSGSDSDGAAAAKAPVARPKRAASAPGPAAAAATGGEAAAEAAAAATAVCAEEAAAAQGDDAVEMLAWSVDTAPAAVVGGVGAGAAARRKRKRGAAVSVAAAVDIAAPAAEERQQENESAAAGAAAASANAGPGANVEEDAADAATSGSTRAALDVRESAPESGNAEQKGVPEAAAARDAAPAGNSGASAKRRSRKRKSSSGAAPDGVPPSLFTGAAQREAASPAAGAAAGAAAASPPSANGGDAAAAASRSSGAADLLSVRAPVNGGRGLVREEKHVASAAAPPLPATKHVAVESSSIRPVAAAAGRGSSVSKRVEPASSTRKHSIKGKTKGGKKRKASDIDDIFGGLF